MELQRHRLFAYVLPRPRIVYSGAPDGLLFISARQ